MSDATGADGHGVSPRPKDAFTVDDLAASVIKVVEDRIGRRPFTYAGVSVAGAVGLQLLLGDPERIVSAALICTAAGLSVAIPSYVAFRYLRGRVDGIVVRIEKDVVHFAEALNDRAERADAEQEA